MTKKITVAIIFLLCIQSVFAQPTAAAKKWADSVFKSLSKDEKIGQLMVVRLSSIDNKTRAVTFFDEKVAALIKQYNIGGVCIFQGGPVKQATIINSLQAMAKTPLLMCIDAEWGLGMRLTDSVLPLPKQMMLGAMKDQTIVYKYGQLVAEQCKRFGLQVNYAPVVDVNNNPNNPVINDRSFGEDKYKVAAYGIQYMKGMQDAGVMACAKHFPGHGDVEVDSHFDLPIINKTRAQLDSLELYPFKQIFAAGISSVMIAHLSIPAIDKTPNKPTSLSALNINGLMRKELGYNGLTFTDGLEMQGVVKYFPDGEASLQSIIAGNDMLCLPVDVPLAIIKIKQAIKKKLLTWADIEMHCKKVLMAKYEYGLTTLKPINTENITADLNKNIPEMRRLVAENAITLVAKKDASFFPLRNRKEGDVAFVGFGLNEDNTLAQRMRMDYNAAVFYFDIKKTYDDSLLKKLMSFKKVVMGIHGLSRTPATNFGLTKDMVRMINSIQQKTNSFTFLFANAYAAKNMCDAVNLAVCYEDDAVVQNTAADLLQGKIFYKGVLPVTVCENLQYGFGIETKASATVFEHIILNGFMAKKLADIDSICKDAIAKYAIPGCVVLALKDNKLLYEKSFGNFTYEKKEPVVMTTVYDLASVTKIAATTLAIMRLYEQGKLDIKKTLGYYLQETNNTNKKNIIVENLLLHEAGLVAYIPFYKEVTDAGGKPYPWLFKNVASDSFNVPVAEHFFMKNAWKDSMYKKILMSPLGTTGKYVYSDNDFIFLAKIAEKISGKTIEDYVAENFYEPMQLHSIGFHPLYRNSVNMIAPTEKEVGFRNQQLQGFVHDPGAAMFGGVAGHAGLFANAYDLAAVMQMLENGGTFNHKKYFEKSTIDTFIGYHSSTSRRGYGFDKPEKDNATRKEPYPALAASAGTFGHTGYTGTCTWADPANGLVFVFLSNRVYPFVNDALLKMNVRIKILDKLYEAIALTTGSK